MKLLNIITILFSLSPLSLLAEGTSLNCPELTGIYTCQSEEGNYDLEIKQSGTKYVEQRLGPEVVPTITYADNIKRVWASEGFNNFMIMKETEVLENERMGHTTTVTSKILSFCENKMVATVTTSPIGQDLLVTEVESMKLVGKKLINTYTKKTKFIMSNDEKLEAKAEGEDVESVLKEMNDELLKDKRYTILEKKLICTKK